MQVMIVYISPKSLFLDHSAGVVPGWISSSRPIKPKWYIRPADTQNSGVFVRKLALSFAVIINTNTARKNMSQYPMFRTMSRSLKVVSKTISDASAPENKTPTASIMPRINFL